MIAALHRARSTEDGQALVLAAIVALVLALCVLGTASLGRTVAERVQLQAAADSAAYSQAAMEARVFNFTAYTNRAMVVHYASAMAATAYLAWAHYLWAGIAPLVSLCQSLPYVGEAAAAIKQGVQALLVALDAGVALFVPLLAGLNLMLYGLQEGAWWSVYARLGRELPPEAHGGDSAAHPYVPIWPHLLPLANQAAFAQTRGHAVLARDTEEAGRILLDSKDRAAERARLQMLEIANSARDPWTAYGDRFESPSASPLARHFRARLACVELSSLARTEMGTAPANSLLPGSSSVQIWSTQKLQGHIDCLMLDKRASFFSFTAMDRLPRGLRPSVYSATHTWSPGVLGSMLLFAVPLLGVAISAMSSAADTSAPQPDERLFWMSPFVNFAPRASARPGFGPTGALGHFGQPDVVIGLAKESRDLDVENGADRVFARRFASRGAGADLSLSAADWPRLPGPHRLQLLHKGLNAFAAAQVYYHRPGDWKEMPNFFNPLWGARLMPVLESNVAAKLGLSSIPALSQFLRH